MIKSCKQCGEKFEIFDEDLDFYKKMEVPPPTLCPSCRMRKRTAFRNERNLYKTKCSLTGVDMLSVYPPTTRFKVYDQKIWWSDKWDAMEYGRDFAFDRGFFDQFEELVNEVPRINLQNRANENSDYCNDTNDLKDCYLCFNSEQAQNFYYCNTSGFGGKDCMDLFWVGASELCYECSKSMRAYHCFWCLNCTNVSDCYFCEHLTGCKNCFGCSGLVQKEYFIYNKNVGREKFEEFIKSFSWSYEDCEEAKKRFSEVRLTVPHKNLEITQCENCFGDYLANAKNCVDCFDVMVSEDCRYVWDALVKWGYDCFNVGLDSSFMYESLAVYRGNNIKFCDKCTFSNDLTYCDFCFQCSNCFGCACLRHKKYCILNKQYSREEYEELLPKIVEYMLKIGEYGEFFPAKISPFGYNDSMAQEYFPLSKEEALKLGFHWNDYVRPEIALSGISADELPGKISDVGDDILNKAIKCKGDFKLFKIIPQELDFYRKHNLPLPRFCPDCRHFARKGQVNPRVLVDRECDKCGIDMKSTYEKGRPEIVYCQECYLKEIY